MPVYLLLWHQQCGRGKKSWQKKRILGCPSLFDYLVSVERMTGLVTLKKEKVTYLGWLPRLLGYQAILRTAFFACSLVSCHIFRNSAVVVCVSSAYRCIQTSGCVCCCVCHSRDFFLVAVLSCSYLSFCLFGSTDFVHSCLKCKNLAPLHVVIRLCIWRVFSSPRSSSTLSTYLRRGRW